MKNVCLVDFGYVIDSVGGAERVLVDLANGLALRGINVSVVACENKDGDPYYKLNDGVRFYNIHQDKELSLATRVCRKLLKIVRIDYRFSMNKRSIDRELKKIFIEEDVDIILNFFPHHLYYVLGNRPRSVPVIQMLHGSADWFHSYLKNINDFTIYNRINEVDVLQVLLPSYKKELQKELSVRIETIPNMVSKQPRCKYTKKIVYLARYDVDKQVHLLIRSFAKIADRFPEWQLHVYGMEYTNGYKKRCQDDIIKLDLTGHIFLHEAVSKIGHVLTDASICAFPSSYEGFGLALCEAMGAGLPCVGYRSCSGVNEIIEDGVNGFLVDDGIDDFALKLSWLMDNPDLCREFGENAIKNVEKYSEAAIIQQWIDLIESLKR